MSGNLTELTAVENSNPPNADNGNPESTEVWEIKETLASVQAEVRENLGAWWNPFGRNNYKLNLESKTVCLSRRELRNIQNGLKKAGQYLPADLKLETEKIGIRNLENLKMAVTRKEGIFIAPELLLQPMNRLAATLYHEALHNNLEVPNEGLVHGLTEKFFGKTNAPETYEKAVKAMREVAKIFSGNADRGLEEIYRLYAEKKFNELYSLFMERVAKKNRNYFFFNKTNHPSPELLFQEAFPELKKEVGGDLK